MLALSQSTEEKGGEFSIASMYRSALTADKASESEDRGVLTAVAARAKDEDQPLRVESIYNMTLIQRPQTAIVTHGEETEQDENENTTIDEEGELWTSADSLKGGGADVWVADEDGDASTSSPTSLSVSLDDSVVNESNLLRVQRSSDDECSSGGGGGGGDYAERLAASYTRFVVAPTQKGDSVAVAASSLGDGEGRAIRTRESPPLSPLPPSSPSSSAMLASGTDGVAGLGLHSGLVRSVWTSSMGNLSARCLSDNPEEFWLSSGLFPQVLTLTFGHDVAVESVDVEACGVFEVHVVMSSQGSSGEVLLPASSLSSCSHAWVPPSNATSMLFDTTLGTAREQQHLDLRKGVEDSIAGGVKDNGARQPVVCRSLSLVATKGVLDFFAVYNIKVHGKSRVYEQWCKTPSCSAKQWCESQRASLG